MSAHFLRMMGFEKLRLKKEIHFCVPKNKDKELWFRSSFFYLGALIWLHYLLKKDKRVIEKTGLMHTESVEIFEYGKSNDGYWDGAKLHQQVVNKALS